jgi:hypothetical protein
MNEQVTTPLERRTIEIRIDNRQFSVQEGPSTGAALLELAGVQLTNQLFLEVSGPGEDTPIGNDESIHLHAGMKFYAIPVGTFG